MRYHTNFFLLSVAFCKMGHVRGGLIYRSLQIRILQLFFVGIFSSIQTSTTFTYLPTVPCLRTLSIVKRFRALYSILTRISKTSTSTYIYNNHDNTYKTTATTNIQKRKDGLPIHAHRNRSFAGESQRCCMYFSFSKTNHDIDPTQFISHPFQLPCPPSSSSSSLFSSLIPSHPLIHLILTHPVPRLSQFLLLGNPQKSRSTFRN